MKLKHIMTLTALIVASASALHSTPSCQAGNMPAGDRQEESNMSNMKVIMLIEAKIQPERRAELIEAAQQYIPLVRAEPGVEAFYLSTRMEDPNTFVFYEVYKSQAAQDLHLQQDFTKRFLATLKNAQAADRVRTKLVDVTEQAEAHSK
ncbi:MAG TPA: putative quinol monooxygenase [Candidatus Angelobacter sp.]|nr:putative quinol monooxygenase [Candidatus Angelobacter sp.]